MSAVGVGSPAERDVWERLDTLWHVVAAVTALGAILAVLVARRPLLPADGPPWSVIVLVLVVLVAGWYAVAGARVLDLDEPGRPGVRYVAGAAPLILTIFAIDPLPGGILLFALYPQLWRMLSLATATGAAVLVSATIATAQIVRYGASHPAALPGLLGWTGGALAAALILGWYVGRIVQQSTERARLLAELESTRAELAAVSHDAGILAERQRLTGEIHDTLAQGFSSIVLLARGADRDDDVLQRIEAVARTNLAESRAIVAAGPPPQLHEATLPVALRRLAAAFGDETGGETDVRVEGVERPLPSPATAALVRVAQEALTNVRRHAAASRVELVLGYAPERVVLRICDDGRGFDTGTPAGYGIDGMRHRVAAIGGQLTIRSAAGAGTTVEAVL